MTRFIIPKLRYFWKKRNSLLKIFAFVFTSFFRASDIMEEVWTRPIQAIYNAQYAKTYFINDYHQNARHHLEQMFLTWIEKPKKKSQFLLLKNYSNYCCFQITAQFVFQCILNCFEKRYKLHYSE